MQRATSASHQLRTKVSQREFALDRANTISHKGFSTPDPFAPRQRPGASFFSALLATALFRCWHILIFFGAWATLITVLNERGHKLTFASTLLTVIGTVLGFVISYRTTSSFERYNEGRRLWSQMILATRTFARTLWFHVPSPPATAAESAEVLKARDMIEKKTVINLLEAFSVAVKHYLRGEDGIFYEDLYYLVKFLPAYALPTGIPSHPDLSRSLDSGGEPLTPMVSPSLKSIPESPETRATGSSKGTFLHQRTNGGASQAPAELPAPVTAPKPRKTTSFSIQISKMFDKEENEKDEVPLSPMEDKRPERVILHREDEKFLLPARDPPKYGIFDLFPFSLLVKALTKRGRELKGKKAARLRAKMRNVGISHNLPLEISLYLSSYIAALQVRKINEVPTTNTLILALNQLVDSLTGLERILTTPIPFSYSIHLWVVTIIYCFALPPQIYSTLKWFTIPATCVLTFIFFGFLVAGEEIENPFGYDKNDLNLDHFTRNIIRNELQALTSTAPPDPARWAFAPENDLLFARDMQRDERVTPDQWMKRGYPAMQSALS